METLTFKNDTRLRKLLWTPDAMQHPAKGHCGMWQEIIMRYTEPGQTVLDPMAGIGTTLLAARVGRDVICVEKESHFIEPMRASWAKMQTFGPEMGYSNMGSVTILQGDARNLEGLLCDAVITSPPYEGDTEPHRANGMSEYHNGKRFGGPNSTVRATGYTRPQAIVTSPPYAESEVPQLPGSRGGKLWKEGGKAARLMINHRYGGAPDENIGNMKGQQYWDACRIVYQQCHNVLADGGVMVLVTKGFTRDGKYQDLPGQTKALVESLGFSLFDEWLRELWTLSFWRILQQRRDPAAFDERLKFETVQAFRKVGGNGNVDAVITSPPYEGIATSSGLGSVNKDDWGHEGTDIASRRGLQVGYTRKDA